MNFNTVQEAFTEDPGIVIIVRKWKNWIFTNMYFMLVHNVSFCISYKSLFIALLNISEQGQKE